MSENTCTFLDNLIDYNTLLEANIYPELAYSNTPLSYLDSETQPDIENHFSEIIGESPAPNVFVVGFYSFPLREWARENEEKIKRERIWFRTPSGIYEKREDLFRYSDFICENFYLCDSNMVGVSVLKNQFSKYVIRKTLLSPIKGTDHICLLDRDRIEGIVLDGVIRGEENMKLFKEIEIEAFEISKLDDNIVLDTGKKMGILTKFLPKLEKTWSKTYGYQRTRHGSYIKVKEVNSHMVCESSENSTKGAKTL